MVSKSTCAYLTMFVNSNAVCKIMPIMCVSRVGMIIDKIFLSPLPHLLLLSPL